jgi:hypothetical protein
MGLLDQARPPERRVPRRETRGPEVQGSTRTATDTLESPVSSFPLSTEGPVIGKKPKS